MALIVVSFGLNGIGWRKGFLRGSDERYPLTTVRFLFFRAILLGREAAVLHMNAMFGLADDSGWLLSNYPSLKTHLKRQRAEVLAEAKSSIELEVKHLRERSQAADERASKAEAENYALRKVIKICSE